MRTSVDVGIVEDKAKNVSISESMFYFISNNNYLD